jgi:hypothetical protein
MLHVNKQQPGLSAGSASGSADQGCMQRLTDVAHLDRFDSFASSRESLIARFPCRTVSMVLMLLRRLDSVEEQSRQQLWKILEDPTDT